MGKYKSSYTGAQIELAIAKARGLDDLTVVGGVIYVDGVAIESGSGDSTFAVVADITARDLLASTILTAFVVDATGDATVDAGSATYVLVNSSWVKSSETEPMDFTDLSSRLNTVSGDLDSLELEVATVSGDLDSLELVVAGVLPFTGSFTSADSTGFSWTDNVLTITHSLNSSNVSITIRDGNGEEVSLANDATGVNTIAVYFPVGNVPISGAYTTSIKK